jgi:rubrerythrin
MTNAEHPPAAGSSGGADRAGEAQRAAEASRAADLGGDPVCWLHLVCPECGRLTSAEGDGNPGACPECGAETSG